MYRMDFWSALKYTVNFGGRKGRRRIWINDNKYKYLVRGVFKNDELWEIDIDKRLALIKITKSWFCHFLTLSNFVLKGNYIGLFFHLQVLSEF